MSVDGGFWNRNIREIQEGLVALGADVAVNGILSNTTIRELQVATNLLGADPPLAEDGGLGNDSIRELQFAVIALGGAIVLPLPFSGFDFSETDRRDDPNEDGSVIRQAGIIDAEVQGAIVTGTVATDKPFMYLYGSPPAAEVTISGVPALKAAISYGYFYRDSMAGTYAIAHDPSLTDCTLVAVAQFDAVDSMQTVVWIPLNDPASSGEGSNVTVAVTPSSVVLASLNEAGDGNVFAVDESFEFDPLIPHVYTLEKVSNEYRLWVDDTELDLTWEPGRRDAAAYGPLYEYTAYPNAFAGVDTGPSEMRQGGSWLYHLLSDPEREAVIADLMDRWVVEGLEHFVPLSTALFDLNERALDGGTQVDVPTVVNVAVVSSAAESGAVEVTFTGGVDAVISIQWDDELADVQAAIDGECSGCVVTGTPLSTPDGAWFFEFDGDGLGETIDAEATADTITGTTIVVEVGQAGVSVQTVWPDQTVNGNDGIAGDGGQTTDTFVSTFGSGTDNFTFYSGPSHSTGGTSTLHIGAPFNDDVVLPFDATVGDVVTLVEAVTGVGTVDLDNILDEETLLEDNSATSFLWAGVLDDVGPTCTLDTSTLVRDGYGLCGSEPDPGVQRYVTDVPERGFVVGSDAHGSTLTALYGNDSAMWVPGATVGTLFIVWTPGDEYGGDAEGSETCDPGFAEDDEYGAYDDLYGYADDPENSYVGAYTTTDGGNSYGAPQSGEPMIRVLRDGAETTPAMHHIDGPAMDPQTMYAGLPGARDMTTLGTGVLFANYTGGGYCAPGRQHRRIGFTEVLSDAEVESVRDQIIAYMATKGVTITKRAVSPAPGTVSGIVTDENDDPVEGAIVNFQAAETHETAADGSYSGTHNGGEGEGFVVHPPVGDTAHVDTWVANDGSTSTEFVEAVILDGDMVFDVQLLEAP